MFLGDARAQVLNKAWSIYEFENSALDSKGHNISTATGITYADSGTVDGNYAIFNGSTSKIDLNVTDNYTEFTFMVKLYITALATPGNYYTFLSKCSHLPNIASDFPFTFAMGASGFPWLLIDGGGGSDFSADTYHDFIDAVSLNTVTTIVISVKEGAGTKYCMNKGSVRTQALNYPYTMSNNSRPWTLGQHAVLNGNTAQQTYFAGRMYQAAYWTTQLTDAEMQLL